MASSSSKVPDFGDATVKALLSARFDPDRKSKISAEAVRSVSELLRTFVVEGINRAAVIAREEVQADSCSEADEAGHDGGEEIRAANDRRVTTVDVEPVHLESVLPQLILDFSG